MAKQKTPQAQVQVDLSKADTIKCDDCGNYLFITSHVIKRISPILSPTGQEAIVPVQVYSCGNCGKVIEDTLKGLGCQTFLALNQAVERFKPYVLTTLVDI